MVKQTLLVSMTIDHSFVFVSCCCHRSAVATPSVTRSLGGGGGVFQSCPPRRTMNSAINRIIFTRAANNFTNTFSLLMHRRNVQCSSKMYIRHTANLYRYKVGGSAGGGMSEEKRCGKVSKRVFVVALLIVGPRLMVAMRVVCKQMTYRDRSFFTIEHFCFVLTSPLELP